MEIKIVKADKNTPMVSGRSPQTRNLPETLEQKAWRIIERKLEGESTTVGDAHIVRTFVRGVYGDRFASKVTEKGIANKEIPEIRNAECEIGVRFNENSEEWEIRDDVSGFIPMAVHAIQLGDCEFPFVSGGHNLYISECGRVAFTLYADEMVNVLLEEHENNNIFVISLATLIAQSTAILVSGFSSKSDEDLMQVVSDVESFFQECMKNTNKFKESKAAHFKANRSARREISESAESDRYAEAG